MTVVTRAGEADLLSPPVPAPATAVTLTVVPDIRARSRTALPVERLVVAAADAAAVLLVLAVLPVREVPVLVAAAVAVWVNRGLYVAGCRLSVLDQVPSLAAGVSVGLIAAQVVHQAPVTDALRLAGVLLVLVVLTRALALAFLRWCRRHGAHLRRTVVVGSGPQAAVVARRIQEHPEAGLTLSGFLGSVPEGIEDVPRRGEITDLPAMLAERTVDAVVVADAWGDIESAVADQLRATTDARADVYVVPRLAGMNTRGFTDQIWGIPLRRLIAPRSITGPVLKRGLDIACAGFALLLALPVLAVAALAVRIELGAAVLYRQERVGRGGQPFQLLKLRTMRPPTPGAPAGWSTDFARVGPVGRFLRRYSLDELPQLFNVLRGDMSLVGPRPERPEYVEEFGRAVPSYVHRHRMMVGLTGLAAVEGLRGDTSIEERARFDNWYIENWSLWLDLTILVRTVVAVLRGTGG